MKVSQENFIRPVFLLMLLSLALHIWGIQRDLPYSEELDETFFVKPAIQMTADNSLNPKWFGNPGSTLIYPLTALFHLRNIVVNDGELMWPDPDLVTNFENSSADFYLFGRYLCVLYGVLSLPLLYMLGREAVGRREALIACFMYLLFPLSLGHAQMIRTDSPAVFFGLLSLWMCLRLKPKSSNKSQILTGAAIGLAIATRYFMVALVPVYLVANLLLLRNENKNCRLADLYPVTLGMTAIGAAFFLSTPFFFIDFGAAINSITVEARSSHIGADGFSRLENFVWYWTHSIPNALTVPVFIAALLGVKRMVVDQRTSLFLLGLFVLVFVIGVSLSALHWDRWIIPVLPVMALLAGAGTVEFARLVRQKFGIRILGGLTLLIAAQSAYLMSLQNLRQHNPSTRVMARHWIIANAPSGSVIFQEWYTAHLGDTPYYIATSFSLSQAGNLEFIQNENAAFVLVSSFVYQRFFNEPQRYSHQVKFYRELFAKGRLEKVFRPSRIMGGPEIRIYRLLPIPGGREINSSQL